MSIKIENLYKKYGKKEVLHGIDINIESGILGLIGSNGAGKTTFIKCLLNITNYSGNIEFSTGKKFKVGYLPQDFDMLRDLSVQEALEYFSILKGDLDKKEIEKILEKVTLTESKQIPIKSLSGGMRRRVGIAQALLHHPDLLIVDEPTAGLDPGERVKFRNLLHQLPKDIIVIISTHIIEDLVGLCDKLAIMSKGNIVQNGLTSELLSQIQDKVYEIIISYEKISEYRQNYTVSREVERDGGMLLRIVGDYEFETKHRVNPTIEDLFFYYAQNHES